MRMLRGEGTIERAIVWDGAEVVMPAEGVVITMRGVRVPVDRVCAA